MGKSGQCFACVLSKTLKTPNLSPMADDAITWGGMRGLGSPFIYVIKRCKLYQDIINMFGCVELKNNKNIPQGAKLCVYTS